MSKAIVISTGLYNVKDYGILDDNSTDNTSAFTALLATIPDGASIYFPGGGAGYLFTGNIAIQKNVIIYGDGYSSYPFYVVTNTPQKGATNLYFNSATARFLSFQASSTNLNPIVQIKDLSIINTASSTPTAGSAIDINNNVAHHEIRRVTIYGFYVNIECLSGNWLTVKECNIVAPIYAGLIFGNSASADLGGFDILNTKVISGLIGGNSPYGIYYKGGGDINITGCDFNAQSIELAGSRTTQFKYQIYITFENGPSSDVHIINNFFENYDVAGIWAINSSGGTMYNMQIAHNEISPFNVNGAIQGPAIHIANWNVVSLIDNIGGIYTSLGTPTNAFIELSGCTNVIIIPGYQAGWLQYWHDDGTSVGILLAVLTPWNGNQNSSQLIAINNASTGSSATSGMQYEVNGASGYIYYTGSAYGFGLASSLIVQIPSGDFVVYGASQALTVKNNGHLLLKTATDNHGFLQIAANTATDPAIFLNPSSAIDVTTVARGMLWDNGTNLYYGTGAGTKVDLLAGGGGGISGSGTSGQVALFNGGSSLNSSANLLFSSNLLSLPTNNGTGLNMQIGSNFAVQVLSAISSFFGVNVKYNGTNTVFITANQAAYLQFNLGAIFFQVSAAGLAGGTITPITAMSVLNNGRILINSSTDNSTAEAQITSTTAQLALHYDATHDLIFTVGSTGNATLTPSGTDITMGGTNVNVKHVVGTGSAPTTSGLGTNVTSATITGTDNDFKMVIVTSGAVSGSICNIAPAVNWGAIPNVVFSSGNAATAGACSAMWGGATSVSNYTIGGTISGAGTYTFYYHVAQ